MLFIIRLFFLISLVSITTFTLVYGGLLTFDALQVDGSNEYIKDFLSAFLGAFFAFLFVIVGAIVNKIHNRRIKHRNAIVRLEYDLNEMASINFDNTALLEGLIQAIRENTRFITSFTPLEYNKEILLKIGNIDLINDVFLLYTDIRKINHSLTTAWGQYEDIWNTYIEGKIKKDVLNENLSNLLKELLALKNFLENLDSKIEILSAKVIALYKSEETFVDWLFQKSSVKVKYPKNFQYKYTGELKDLRNSKEQIMKDSKKEIRDTLQKASILEIPL